MQIAKRIAFTFAVLIATVIAGATSASAQISCNGSAAPTLVRSQGISEFAGSIAIGCGGGSIVGIVSITVSFQPSTAVVTNDTITPGITAINSGGTAPLGSIIVSGNTVTVPFTGTGTVGTIGISGIRINAAASGVVFPSQIGALLTASPVNILTISPNSVNVAIPQSGMTATITAGAGIPQCASSTFAGLADAPAQISITPIASAGNFSPTGATLTVAGKVISGGTTAKVTVAEGFAYAFLTKIDEGGGPTGSTQGTRFMINFTGLPSNVALYAPERLTVPAAGTLGSLNLTLVANADLNGSGGALTSGLTTFADLINGSSITYEVTTDDPANANGIVIPIQIYTTGVPSPSGNITESVALGPVSTVGTAAAGAPIPRFSNTPASGTAAAVIPCLTNILFPYVYNTAGYDTGFSIANTTSDLFGTAAQSGTCVYNFFGSNAPSGGTFTTSSVGGGQVDTRLLSVIAPGFAGYIMAQCNFQLGHGYAVIQNGYPGGVVTTSYVVNGRIILQPGSTSGTSRKGIASVGPPFGEGLGE